VQHPGIAGVPPAAPTATRNGDPGP